MKLNSKGYMLVEIIVASVLAMTICYYLINLTYKFKNTNEDLHQSYYYTSDKILITKNIMADLENGSIGSVIINPNNIEFEIYSNDEHTILVQKRRLSVEKNDNGTTVKYGKINEFGDYDTNDLSYYEKKLDNTLSVGEINVDKSETGISITIPISSIYSIHDYTIKLFTSAYIPNNS